MKLTKKELDLVEIHNAHNFAAHGIPFIDYQPADNGRLTASYAYWGVYRPGYQIDKSNWHGGGCKQFTVTCRENKAPVLEEAQKWAGERYGIKEWTKTPFGSYMEAGYVTTRLEELKALVTKHKQEHPNGNAQ